MLRLNMAYFKGKSGNPYNFLVYSWGTKFKKGRGAVYCVTNRYVKKDRSKYGASCVCVREEPDKDIRVQVVQDLIDNYAPPCNKIKEH